MMRVAHVDNSWMWESGDVFEITQLEEGDAQRLIEIRNWCTIQFGERIGRYPRWKFDTFHQTDFNRSAFFFFWFKEENDALMFKIRWL